MKSIIKFIILLSLVSSCSKKYENQAQHSEKFTSELIELKEYFKIPGLAVSVEENGKSIYKNYLGFSDVQNAVELDSTASFPIASLTKVFSAVLIMKLVEQEKLSLEDPINKYLQNPIFGDSILIKHILSHTSQGDVGKEFYYSSRFGSLTNVIERVSETSFDKFLDDIIIKPLELENTFLLKDSTQVREEKRIIAKPYILDNGIEDGFMDFGYSTSAGIVSNLEDLATFYNALDNEKLISEKSRDLMFSSYNSNSPYGYGIFNQQFEGVNIVWAYGQYDCYSSLLLKVPSKNISLTLLANNSLLSDPARLIYGDVTSSLFALSFLKNYIFNLEEMPLFEPQDSNSLDHISNKEFYRKKVLAQALAESYMARFEPEKLQSSSELLNIVFAAYPNYLEYADLNLLHNLSFLKDVAFYRELGPFNNFDTQIVSIGEQLLNNTPENPYVNSYIGTYYARKGDKKKAKYHFENIVNAKNFSKNWYTNEAQTWLYENK